MRRVRRLTGTTLATLGVLVGGLLVSAAPALAAPPETPETVSPATGITATTATLHGVLNPGKAGEPGSYDFSYEPSSSLAPECGMPGTLAPSSPVADAGAEGEAKEVPLTKLEPNKEYAFCIVAYSLSAEPSYGTAVPFKTLALKPFVISESAPTPKAEEARLEALVNPNNEPTECHFEYGKTTASENELPCEQGNALEGGEQGVGVTVSGLQQNTPYHYRVVVKNATGEEEGTEEVFTTALRPETPVTESASAVTGTTATLNGEPNPKVEATIGYDFAYGSGGTCEGLTTTPVAPAKLAAATKVSTPVSELEASTKYTFCVVATNAAGETATGAPVELTTPAAAPVVIGESSSGVTPFAATLQAAANPENQVTTCMFEYGEVVTEHKTPCKQAVLEGSSPQSATLSVSGLTSASKYHYRVVVKNATGEVRGAEEEFETQTAEKPTIYSESISGLSATGVVLGARINPDYQSTTYAFEYSTKESAGVLEAPITRIKGANPLPSASGELPVSGVVNGLAPGTTYYYRVIAENETSENEGKPVEGTVASFITPPVPLVSTGEAQSITQTTATLSGTVNPEGAETTYYFQYVSEVRYQAALAEGASNPYAAGETTARLTLTEPGGGPYTGTEPQAVGPIPAAGLHPGITYHYRIVAYNKFEGKIETSYGQDATFTTLPGTPPIVGTGGASGVSQGSATLSGTVGTNGLQTSYGFEIGTESGDYGPATGLGSIGGAATEAVSVTLVKLRPGTTYYYRVSASNADGTSYGEPRSFATPGFPALIAVPAALPLIATPNIAFPTEEKPKTATPKPLTNAQKLTKALKACHKLKKKSRRVGCEKQAHKRYGPKKKKK